MEKDSDNIQENILNAAIQLFTRKGYINTSMDEIAEAVGLTKGGLYHYVEKKENLLTDIHDQFLGTFFERVGKAISRETDPSRKLASWISTHASVIKDFQAQVKVFFTEVDHISEDTFNRMLKKRDLAVSMLREIIFTGISRKEMRRDINPHIASFLILGMINWLYIWYRPNGPLSIEEIIDNMDKIILSGLIAEDRYQKGDAKDGNPLGTHPSHVPDDESHPKV